MSNYTNNEANAIATLMQYCGYSVLMDYGPVSSSNSIKVTNALKEYFDYNTTTTQLVLRSYYTAAKWADLIYHELANNRPVVYGGQSSGGGHEFVCDGYKNVDGTDFFHINWGWGGQSDNYFVLSALDPYAQGIGGSSSTDGYHYGQDAVIGIQPSTGTGSIANVTPNNVSLTLNSMTPSSNPIIGGVPVDITLNITNNSSDNYDGDIYLGRKVGDDYRLLKGNNFLIPAGETKDVVIPFIPTAIGTYDLVLFLPNTEGTYSTNCVVYATLNVVAPDGLTVYDGTETTNQYVPAYIKYFDNFTRSQFVIPAADLTAMDGGTINSMSFYTTSDNIPYTTLSTVDVYVKEVNYTSISTFETKESSSVVYQGILNVISTTDGGLLTIPFNTPYTYNGGNLLIGIENTTDEDYKEVHFYGQTVYGASVAGFHATSLEDVTPTQQNFIPKTTFDYTAATGVVYHKPITLAVSEVTAGTATLSWTAPEGEVTGYAYQYKEMSAETWSTEESVTTTSVTISGLAAATAYIFRVKTLYGSNESGYVITDFTTDLSDDKCSITLELTDYYGDGWDGAAIQVVDDATGIVIGTYTNENLNSIIGDGTNETNTHFVSVPNDRDIHFVWVSGKYDAECSFVIYDVNGKVIYAFEKNGTGPSEGVLATYHVDCRYTPNPSDLTVTPAPTTAIVTWTGIADSYDVRYAPFTSSGAWLKYDDGTKVRDLGNSSSSTWTWGVMYPSVTGNMLTKVSFYENNYATEDITVKIYSGNDAPSGIPLRTVDVSPMGSTGFHEFTFDTPIEITPGENIWIVLTATGTYVMPLCDSAESNNQWIYYGGTWENVSKLNASFASNGWMIRGYFESTANPESVSWAEDTSTSGSYTITGLTPETDYMVQVRGDYGSDGKSEWVTSLFATPAANATPTDLAADLLDDGATLSWTGYQDSYDVRYRTAGWRNVYFFDDFESGSTTAWEQNDSNVFTGVSYSGTYFVALGYNSTATQYLISPELGDFESGATLEFYQRYLNSETTFKVGFSSTTSDVSAFTWGDEQTAASSYTLYQQVVPEGTKYIAIQTTATPENNALLIDNYGVFGPSTEPGEWQESNIIAQAGGGVQSPTLTLTGLTPGTKYEWQVKGKSEGNVTTEWSDIEYFTTYIILADNSDNSSIIAQFDWKQGANVKFSGRKLYKDGAWNTLCLPFNIVLDGSPLDGDGVQAMTLDASTSGLSGTTLTLNFTPATTIPAGTPFIIKWATPESPEARELENPVFTGITIDNSTEAQARKTVSFNGGSFCGIYDPTDIYSPGKDNLYLGADNKLYYPWADGMTSFNLNAFRAYFHISGTSAVREFKLNFGEDNETVGITTTDYTDYTDSGEAWYTLDGRKLGGKPTKSGLYIHNGKKVAIK